MFENTLFKSTLFRSFGASTITGGLTELLKIILLYYNVSTSNVLIISLIFGYSIAYVAQRHVFSGGRFFGISLLKYCAVSIMVIQITNILLGIFENNKTIKSYIEDTNISEKRRKIYQYILINIVILIVFFAIEYPLRKTFIFVKNKSIDYKYSYMLYCLSVVIYILNKNYNNLNININNISSTTSNSIVLNSIK